MAGNRSSATARGGAREEVRRLVGDLESVLRALRSGIPQEWFTLEMTMPQVRTLFVLLHEGPSRMGALAGHLGVSLSSATGLVDRLVEKGLVDRWVDPEDRRSVVCRLSQQGQELAERLLQLRRSRWEELLAGLTEEECERALAGLRALSAGLARVGASETTSSVGARGVSAPVKGSEGAVR